MIRFVALVSLVVLAACAEPIPKAEVTPVFSGTAPAQIAVAVSDQRPYIRSADKPSWFEGIFRGAYGIPTDLQRPLPGGAKPFSTYIAERIGEALTASGSQVEVVQLAPGLTFDKAREQVGRSAPGDAIIVLMQNARYDIGWGVSEWNYDFEVQVVDDTGTVVLEKRFAEFLTDVPLSEKYNIPDMFAAIYKQELDKMLRDPDFADALARAASPTS